MNFKIASNFILFLILDLLIFTAFLTIIAAFVTWIWAGWYYGWRTGLSGFVGLLLLGVLKTHYITQYAKQESKAAA